MSNRETYHPARLSIARPTYSSGEEFITVEVYDDDARIRFTTLRVKLSDFMKCLTGQSEVKCEMQVSNLKSVGKRLESKRIEVELPDGVRYGEEKAVAYSLCLSAAPDGWVVANYFNSQSSFTTIDGIRYANTRMSRWVEKT